MNRFYLFSSWVAIFFIIITALFLISSCFYILQLYFLNRKNKRFKKSLEPGERKRNYDRNLKLSTKLDTKIKLGSLSKGQTKRSKQTKTKNESNDVVDKPPSSTKNSPSCFQTLFRIRQKRSKTQSKNEFPEFKSNFGDYLDGQTQSYESFETMTTDSECYRDWRHSIDFTNGVLNLNNYAYNHNNEIMQKAYEQLYAQEYHQNRRSNGSLNQNQLNRDEVSIPIQVPENDDLYPVSVLPYEFEPQPIHLYDPLHDDQQVSDDQLSGRWEDKANKTSEKTKKNKSNQNDNSSFSSQKDDKKASAKNEAIIKKDTLVSVRADGKVKLITSDLNKDNLDRNMNLLTEN